MTKYTIAIEETIVKEFEVFADNTAAAMRIAEKKYNEFVNRLESTNVDQIFKVMKLRNGVNFNAQKPISVCRWRNYTC